MDLPNDSPFTKWKEDFEYPVLQLRCGRSALDLANDVTTTQDELRAAVQEESMTNTLERFMWSLSKAAKDGNLSAVRRMVEAGANIHAKDKTGWDRSSAIWLAARRTRQNVIYYLLDIQASRIRSFSYTVEALETAIKDFRYEDAARLAAEKNFINDSIQVNSEALCQAASHGDVALVKLLVQQGAKVHDRDLYFHHKNPLEAAAKYGHLELCQFFLAQGAALEGNEGDLRSPLRFAAAGGYSQIVELLLHAGADPLIFEPLKKASSKGHLEVVDLLLQAEPAVDLNEGALQEAASGGHLDVVVRLLQAGADVNALPYYPGLTALQAAAIKGSIDVVQTLVKAGADVNKEAKSWKPTALEAAAEQGNDVMVGMLLDAGARVRLYHCNYDGCTSAIDRALSSGHTRIAERLLEQLTPEEINEHASEDNVLGRALYQAAFGGLERIVHKLLGLGARPAEIDRLSPLVATTAANGHIHILRDLLDAGAVMDRKRCEPSADGRCKVSWHPKTRHGNPTALQSAVLSGHLEAVKLLISYGADVNAAPGRMKPPLHIACARGYLDVTKLLLAKKANVRLLSYKRQDALYYAEKSQNKHLIELIRLEEATAPPQRNPAAPSRIDTSDVSSLIRSETCTTCRSLSDSILLNQPSKQNDMINIGRDTGYHFDQSLAPLREAAHKGCPFCKFLCDQLDISSFDESHFEPTDVLTWSLGEKHYGSRAEFPTVAQRKLGGSTEVNVKGRRTRPQDTILPDSSHHITTWFRHCVEFHPKCRQRNVDFRPTRLLDLTQWHKEERLRLIETRTTKPINEAYVALSHRWDTTVQAVATTSDNLHARLSSVDPNILSPTFRHAIHVACLLGIHYLWIDSFCIVQNDPQDWSIEAALMSDIYRNSACTIAGNSHDSSCLGLLHTPVDSISTRFALHIKDRRLKLYCVDQPKVPWGSTLDNAPLERRGWCLQERELSPRMLHWTEQQILWECRNGRNSYPASDTDRYSSRNKEDAGRSWDIIEHADTKQTLDLWHRTVERYTKRSLTVEQDTLPAIGGLAQLVNERVQSEYIAGLWAANLQRSLTWVSMEYRIDAKRPHYRYESYIAPSWSWAALNGSVLFDLQRSYGSRPQLCFADKGLAVITGYTVKPSTTNPFGPVSSGELRISAPVIWALHGGKTTHHNAYLKGIHHAKPHEFYGEVEFDVLAERFKYSILVCIALFYWDDKDHTKREGVGLALVAVEGQPNTYRRVGRANYLKMAHFETAPVVDLIII